MFLNINLYAETIYYKNVDSPGENVDFKKVKFPDDCLEIIKISNDQSLEFKNNEGIKKKITECNIFLKGKKVKNTLKSGSDKILDTGVKVKDGIKKGLSLGTESITESISSETNLFLEDTLKLTDGLVNGTSKIIDSTFETGGKIKSGVGSFFKGIFSSDK